MEEQFYSPNIFTLESGEKLPELTIAYNTYGKINREKNNVIWVCHALTANSDVEEWWKPTFEEGQFLDPKDHFIICANILCSPYGSTSPLSENPLSREPYYNEFPLVTVRDIVKAHQLLAQHLEILNVKMLIGSSIGGFQVVEWLISEPEFAKSAVLIATGARAEPWAIAFNESQRMAIRADETFGEKNENAGKKGLEVARSIAMLSYRGQRAYDYSQKDDDSKIDNFKASSYQRYQGEKLAKRFDSYSYYALTKAIDSHDIGRGRNGISEALKSVKAKCTIVCVNSDILFPSENHLILYNGIKRAKMYVIDSNYGHDGFLVESEKLNTIVKKHLREIEL
ncbi:MAG: homoserine O-acetyltransferase [Bacteroidetes bacterium]|nr:homoserine O-acetyltransferase [Bacteroidota bacterium]